MHNGYGHQACQVCSIPQRSSTCTHKLTWGHITNQIYYISTCRRPMDTKTRSGANLLWEAPTIKARWPFDHVSSMKSRCNFKNFSPLSSSFLLFLKDLWSLTLAGCKNWGASSSYKSLSCVQLLTCSICHYPFKLLEDEKYLGLSFRCLATFTTMVISFPFKHLIDFLWD